MRYYSDYFHVDEKYSPNMTREEINRTPERWLDFCPHAEFEEICKTLLLFCLMDRLTPGGHVRLRPTVENVVLSFRGDSTISDPEGMVEILQSKHCFSVSNGQISLFSMSTVKPEDVEKYRPQFYELLHERTQTMLEEKTKNDRQYSSGRFDIRVSDESHMYFHRLSL